MPWMHGGSIVSIMRSVARCAVVVIPIAALVLQLWWYFTNNVSPLEMLVGMLEVSWSWVLSGIALIGLSGRALVRDRRRWWKAATSITAVTVIISTVTTIVWASEPANNVLGRDVIGIIVLAAAIPLISAGVARITARLFAGNLVTSWCCLVASATCLLSSPLVLIAIHCTSGDCL
jgi:hypothetical protein